MNRSHARPDDETLAVEALSFIASEAELLSRFMQISGLEPGDFRAAAAQPGFFVAVLDFLMGHEPDLMAFAAHADVAPEAVVAARHRLAGPDHTGFE